MAGGIDWGGRSTACQARSSAIRARVRHADGAHVTVGTMAHAGTDSEYWSPSYKFDRNLPCPVCNMDRASPCDPDALELDVWVPDGVVKYVFPRPATRRVNI